MGKKEEYGTWEMCHEHLKSSVYFPRSKSQRIKNHIPELLKGRQFQALSFLICCMYVFKGFDGRKCVVWII